MSKKMTKSHDKPVYQWQSETPCQWHHTAEQCHPTTVTLHDYIISINVYLQSLKQQNEWIYKNVHIQANGRHSLNAFTNFYTVSDYYTVAWWNMMTNAITTVTGVFPLPVFMCGIPCHRICGQDMNYRHFKQAFEGTYV